MAYILMIDDNPQTQKLFERVLRHRNQHDVGFASSSYEAVEKMVERRPDVIFQDLFIPGADGFEFFKKIKTHPATSSIPIVIHTVVPLDQMTRLQLKRMKRDVQYQGFVHFPIGASELNRIISDALKYGAVRTEKWIPPKA